MTEKMVLRGKRVLITGGATHLGLCMSRRLLQRGAELVICGRRQSVLKAAVKSLRSQVPGASVSACVCDVRSADQVEALMDAVWAVGGVNVLINNTGTFMARNHNLSARTLDATLFPSLHGALYCTLEVGRRWINAGSSGTVLSIHAPSMITGRSFTVPSAMVKAALLAMTKSLAAEWKPHGIRALAIAPTSASTVGTTSQVGGRHLAAGGGYSSQNPLGHADEHHDVAELASFLISDAASYLNGDMVVIEGGHQLWA